MEKNTFETQVSALANSLKLFQQSTLNTPSQFRLAIFKCQTTFFGTLKKNILIFKLKTFQYLHGMDTELLQTSEMMKEINIIKLLQRKLATLNKQMQVLIQEQILNLYIDLNDIKEFCLSKNLQIRVKNIVSFIIEQFSCLLKQYFIYQEYQFQKKLKNKGKRKSIFSLGKVPSSEDNSFSSKNEIFDEQLLKEIQKVITKKSLSQLFEQEMQKEQSKMKQSLQVCRICFQQIQLSNLQKHVKICAKKSELKLQLQYKNITIAKLEESLKDKYKESCEQMIHERIDEQFRKICKLILNPSRKIAKARSRRNSLADYLNQTNMSSNLENYIEEYLEQFQSQILSDLLKSYKQKGLIQKRLNNLQMNILPIENTLESGTQNSESSTKSKTERKLIYKQFGTEKSRFHQQTEKSRSERSSKSSSSSSIQKKQQREQVISKRLRSKGSLSRRCQKQRQDIPEWIQIKHYSSLQLINFPELKRVQNESSIQLKDFEILSFLGAGAFGKVYLVRRKETKDIYAMKIVKLPDNCNEEQMTSVKNEHQIFKKIAGDHLVKAPFLFSQQMCPIFILQFMPGGDLRKLLSEQVYFQEEKAKFYIAQIVLAIEHLHNYQIIHRDLKPQNLVIDRKGHLKLTDFGLSELQVSKKLSQSRKQEELAIKEYQLKTSRSNRKRRTAISRVGVRDKIKLIGTPDYIAPQIINQTSFSNFSIDWWSLGVMAYELMVGNRPFGAFTVEQVIQNITNMNISWPEVGYQQNMMTPQAKDFIQKLLNKDFTNRLGAKGVDQIKQHPFLQDIDWQNIKSSASMFTPTAIKLSEIVKMQQDIELRKQVYNLVGIQKKNCKVTNFELQQVIRYDLLKSQTIENIEQKKKQSTKRLKKLKTLKDVAYRDKQNIEI